MSLSSIINLHWACRNQSLSVLCVGYFSYQTKFSNRSQRNCLLKGRKWLENLSELCVCVQYKVFQNSAFWGSISAKRHCSRKCTASKWNQWSSASLNLCLILVKRNFFDMVHPFEPHTCEYHSSLFVWTTDLWSFSVTVTNF